MRLFTKALRRINRVVKSRWIGEQLEYDYWKRAAIQEWKLDPNFPIQDKFVPYLKRSFTRILDVGAGMLTVIGKTHKRRIIGITAIDPLADRYAKILRDKGVIPPVVTKNMPIESIKSKYDIVYARNSIDHAENPLKEIHEMIRVCRGVVLMEHFINTGKNENYMGLHQWNFCLVHGNLQVWREGEYYTLFSDNITNEIITEDGYEWIRTKIDCTRPIDLMIL